MVTALIEAEPLEAMGTGAIGSSSSIGVSKGGTEMLESDDILLARRKSSRDSEEAQRSRELEFISTERMAVGLRP